MPFLFLLPSSPPPFFFFLVSAREARYENKRGGKETRENSGKRGFASIDPREEEEGCGGCVEEYNGVSGRLMEGVAGLVGLVEREGLWA